MDLKDLGTDPLPESNEADAFLETIRDLLDDARYSWAADTLDGIAATVTQTHQVTEGQRRAVRNITISVTEKEERKSWGRRYEGYR